MEEQTATKTEDQPQDSILHAHAGPRVFLELRSWFRDILFAFATAIFIVIFVIQPVKVEGTSMQPRLVDQERIFVNRFIYRFTDIHRGDVVVFWYPRDKSKSFIKRVLALPGDEIEIRYGAVYVNGSRVQEPYLKPEYRDHESFRRITVPADQYFVLGDHRNSSNDSRNWGFVPRDLIYGKAIFSYWPMSRVGPVE
ncbi:MAG TPA: signal peptidase I [Acidobacteriota bacterium]|nr:signal peptidase I [Acidobacteriota bacterium]